MATVTEFQGRLTQDQVIELVAEALGVSPRSLHRDSKADDFVEWDSMGTLVVLAALNREGITFEAGDLIALQSVQGILAAFRGGEVEMTAYLRGVHHYLPPNLLSNEDLVRLNPGWDAEKIHAKTGIRCRTVAGAEETASDLGCQAALRLLETTGFDGGKIDALLFCTESPDYFLPPSACLLQTRLGLPTSCAALDFNLGCSGFVYGLWLARSLVESGSAKNVLLIVGDTYSKFCNPHDMATVTLFGDGAGAALVTSNPDQALATIGPTVLGTDGRGAEHLIVRAGAARCRRSNGTPKARGDEKTNQRSDEQLFMNGPEVFNFTLSRVQSGIQQLLDLTRLDWPDIDWFLLHQANRFMLEQLRRKMELPAEKMPISSRRPATP